MFEGKSVVGCRGSEGSRQGTEGRKKGYFVVETVKE